MIEIIQNKLSAYNANNPVEEENALKEIIQEIILFSLWRADFFKVAAFQGGTSLRILHGLTRFSEDIDFILQQADTNFQWQPYLNKVVETCEEFGMLPEVLDKNLMDKNIKLALIKDNSIANQLNLDFMDKYSGRKIKIKLEIDSNPPKGSDYAYTYLDFPVDFEVCHQDLSSNFSLKIHALICRPYIKGRDWYDFNWYVAQRVNPNYKLLQNAIEQYGPWSGHDTKVDENWLRKILIDKISSINWMNAAADVERFIKPIEQKSLSLWSVKFFKSKVDNFLDGT